MPAGFSREKEIERLSACLQRVIQRKGSVLIPSFALGRTQEILALLALLMRSLTEEEVVKAARTVLRQSDIDSPVTAQQIRDAIHEVIAKEPNPEEVHQVAARLASVGWPLENGR